MSRRDGTISRAKGVSGCGTTLIFAGSRGRVCVTLSGCSGDDPVGLFGGVGGALTPFCNWFSTIGRRGSGPPWGMLLRYVG